MKPKPLTPTLSPRPTKGEGGAKPGWGECPPVELPLRTVLPKFRAETVSRLLKFGAGQTFLGGWLCDRGEAYFVTLGENAPDEMTRVCMAAACLDLLAWQAGGMADKAALERLPTDAELNWEKH